MRQDEAIQLAYALAAKAAEAAGVRALAIKGVVSTIHGLRAKRTPADVDILIEPAGFAAVTRQLRAWGWRPRVDEFKGFRVPHHSVTYLHQRWPCDIDAHDRFPGFLAPPGQVFDVLWERREVMPIAGQLVPVTDWAGSVAIHALHAVRSIRDDPRHPRELDRLFHLARAWSRNQVCDLAELARAVGCVQSLDAVWLRLGVPISPGAEDIPTDDLAEWRRKLDGRVPSIRFWLRYLRGGGRRQTLNRARVLLWPPEGRLRAARPFPDGGLALFRARVARLVRALRIVLRNGDSTLRDALGPVHAFDPDIAPGRHHGPKSDERG